MADERTPWIGVSQYKKAKEYQKPNDFKIAKCTYSCTMPQTDITINQILHAGVVTHKCSLALAHKDDCLCLCGFDFKGWS